MILPDYLILQTRWSGISLSEAIESYLDALQSAGFPEVANWQLPSQAEQRSGNVNAFLEGLGNGKANTIENASFRLKDGSSFSFFPFDQSWTCELYLKVDKKNSTGTIRHLAATTTLCRTALNQGGPQLGSLRRQGGGADYFPQVPIVDKKTHLIVCSDAEIESKYDDPTRFHEAGWSAVESYGDRHLFLRAMRAVSSQDFAREIMESQWALARIAKPGLTRYFWPDPMEEELEVYRTGKPVLERVGYLPDEKLLEYSCYLEPGDHVRGWEVYDIRAIIETGELGDHKVERVRVVFYAQEMAEQEKRPLLDVGAEVYYENEAGDLVRIVE